MNIFNNIFKCLVYLINSGCRLCIMVCPSFWEDYYMLIYTHCWELMNSVGSHGSSSLPFVMKVMVCHFVSDSHEVMTALIVVLPLIVVVEISLQLHRSLFDKCFQKFTGDLISFLHFYEIYIQNKQIHLNLLTLIFVKM